MRVLDQQAFQLKGADAVVGALEHVIGTAHVEQVAVGVPAHHVAGTVIRSAQRGLGLVRVARVADHQAHRALGGAQRQAQLALVTLLTVRADQCHAEPRQRAAHASGLDRLSWRVAHLGAGFGLPEAVAQGQVPGPLNHLNHLWVKRFARAHDASQLAPVLGQRLLDQHAPDRRRSTQAGDAQLDHQFQGAARVEALTVDHHRRADGQRHEEVAPGMLGPAGRADVPVDVARLHPQPRQGAQIARWVALVGVRHEFGPAGGAAGEIQQHGVSGARVVCGRVGGRLRGGLDSQVCPALGGPDGETAEAGQSLELARLSGFRDHMLHLAARQPVCEVVG